jgi:hypothetical protein
MYEWEGNHGSLAACVCVCVISETAYNIYTKCVMNLRVTLSASFNFGLISVCIGPVSGLEIREYGRRDPSRWPRGTLYQRKLALTSPISGRRPVGIVRLQTQAMEFSLVFLVLCSINHTLQETVIALIDFIHSSFSHKGLISFITLRLHPIRNGI